jgi:tetratricopeptide (TPR) repeat protein
VTFAETDPLADIPGERVLSERLAEAAGHLGRDVQKVLSGSGEILDQVPGQQQALFLLASALRLIEDKDGARKLLEWMAERHPKLAALQYEFALMLCRRGEREQAIACLKRVVELEPNHAAAWRMLGNQHSLKGETSEAAAGYGKHALLSLVELRLVEDSIVSGNDGIAKAENMLHAALEVNPTDVTLLRLLAIVFTKMGDYLRARKSLARALGLTPFSVMLRSEYADSLQLGMHWQEANEQLEILLAANPENPQYKARMASNLVMMGETERAFALLDELLPELEKNPSYWLNRGHALRQSGQGKLSVEAYRTCLAVDPEFGAAWWGLANLKNYRFLEGDIEKMLAALASENLDNMHRVQLEFAVGQALEDEKKYGEAFQHYCRANELRRRSVHHNADALSTSMKKLKHVFTPGFFRARPRVGCPAPDPIFIVGMVRAGSTLVEQILSSHSLVEGTMELPEMVNIVTGLRQRWPEKSYPELLADLDGPELESLGRQYIAAVQHHRRLGRPFFTDKAGTNLWQVGLIQLILPNAKIIDARRHPLGCCLSAFKQDFPGASTSHSYDMTELGRCYHDYVEMMAHYDRVLPGRVHRVFHENMIRDPEGEIRRLLEFCGLPFEEACLRFYESDRPARTFSSEQVRKPVSVGSSERWRDYEPWLGPLQEALGEVLTLYPEVPAFD